MNKLTYSSRKYYSFDHVEKLQMNNKLKQEAPRTMRELKISGRTGREEERKRTIESERERER